VALAPFRVTAKLIAGRKQTKRRKTTMSNLKKNETKVNRQTVLRDTPSGIPVKTRVKAGLKLDGIKG
jgi:hypothetical protein